MSSVTLGAIVWLLLASLLLAAPAFAQFEEEVKQAVMELVGATK